MDARKEKKYYSSGYVNGTAARQLNPQPRYDEQEERAREERQRRRKVSDPKDRPVTRKAVGRGIDFISMTFLLIVMCATLATCFDYLRAQNENAQLDKDIISKETELKNITDKNNAAENSLNAPVDLDEIYRIAVGELGMVFPNKNEIINYESQDYSYMRQKEEIPEVTQKTILDSIFP